jgi:hypothetical protein
MRLGFSSRQICVEREESAYKNIQFVSDEWNICHLRAREYAFQISNLHQLIHLRLSENILINTCKSGIDGLIPPLMGCASANSSASAARTSRRAGALPLCCRIKAWGR